jgi:hypothetical protein
MWFDLIILRVLMHASVLSLSACMSSISEAAVTPGGLLGQKYLVQMVHDMLLFLYCA